MSALLDSQPDNHYKVIMGDFNFPCDIIVWQEEEEAGAVATLRVTDASASCLVEFAATNFLSQQVLSPTRGESTLDLIYTNNPDVIRTVEVNPFPISDHCMISVRTKIPLPLNRNLPLVKEPLPEIGLFNFAKADWNAVKDAIEGTRLEEMIDEFNDISSALEAVIMRIAECCTDARVPLRKSPRRSHIPPYRKRLFRHRIKLRKQLMSVRSPTKKTRLESQLFDIDKAIKESIDRDRFDEEQGAISQIKENPNRFFAFAQKRSKVNPGIGPLLKPDGQLTRDGGEVAGVLSTQYQSAFSIPSTTDIITNPEAFFQENDPLARCSSRLEDITFTVDDVEATLKSMRAGSAPGPDAVPAVLLKECASVLAPTFYKLFKWSLTSGIVPDSFKVAKITPIFKGGSKQAPKNFRPVALT